MQFRRHGGWGELVVLGTKLQAPQIEIMKHYKSVEISQILECQSPLHKVKSPVENFLTTVLIQ